MQADFAGEVSGCVGHRRDLRDPPLFTFLRQAQAADRPIGPQCQKSDRPGVIHIPSRDRLYGQSGRHGHLTKGGGALVEEDVQTA